MSEQHNEAGAGWVTFAGIILIAVGIFQAFAGLVGMLDGGGVGRVDHAGQLGIFKPRQFLGRGGERMRQLGARVLVNHTGVLIGVLE